MDKVEDVSSDEDSEFENLTTNLKNLTPRSGSDESGHWELLHRDSDDERDEEQGEHGEHDDIRHEALQRPRTGVRRLAEREMAELDLGDRPPDSPLVHHGTAPNKPGKRKVVTKKKKSTSGSTSKATNGVQNEQEKTVGKNKIPLRKKKAVVASTERKANMNGAETKMAPRGVRRNAKLRKNLSDCNDKKTGTPQNKMINDKSNGGTPVMNGSDENRDDQGNGNKNMPEDKSATKKTPQKKVGAKKKIGKKSIFDKTTPNGNGSVKTTAKTVNIDTNRPKRKVTNNVKKTRPIKQSLKTENPAS